MYSRLSFSRSRVNLFRDLRRFVSQRKKSTTDPRGNGISNKMSRVANAELNTGYSHVE